MNRFFYNLIIKVMHFVLINVILTKATQYPGLISKLFCYNLKTKALQIPFSQCHIALFWQQLQCFCIQSAAEKFGNQSGIPFCSSITLMILSSAIFNSFVKDNDRTLKQMNRKLLLACLQGLFTDVYFEMKETRKKDTLSKKNLMYMQRKKNEKKCDHPSCIS